MTGRRRQPSYPSQERRVEGLRPDPVILPGQYNGADCVVLGAAKKNGQNKIGLHTNRQKERWNSHSRNTFSWFGPYQRGFMTCGCPVSVRVSDFCCDGQAHRLTWAKFSREYRHELDKANRTIKNHDQKFTLRVLESLAKFFLRAGTHRRLAAGPRRERQDRRAALFDGLPSSGCGRWTSCSRETKFTGWSRTRTRNPVGRSWHGQAKR